MSPAAAVAFSDIFCPSYAWMTCARVHGLAGRGNIFRENDRRCGAKESSLGGGGCLREWCKVALSGGSLKGTLGHVEHVNLRVKLARLLFRNKMVASDGSAALEWKFENERGPMNGPEEMGSSLE